MPASSSVDEADDYGIKMFAGKRKAHGSQQHWKTKPGRRRLKFPCRP
jgi:hypothetical protein